MLIITYFRIMNWRCLILCLLLLPMDGFSQSRLGFYFGYVNDRPRGDYWFNERGVRLGVSTTPRQFEVLPYNGSFNVWSNITGAKDHIHKSSIPLSIADETGSNFGFGRAEFTRVSFGFNYDLGYSNDTGVVVIPFITMGPRMDYYYSRFYQEVYTPEACNCEVSVSDPVTATSAVGYTLGAGIKFKLSRRLFFDTRWEYYGNWSLRTNLNERLPIANTFDYSLITGPVFDFREERYNSGHIFSFNLIYKFRNRLRDLDWD